MHIVLIGTLIGFQVEFLEQYFLLCNYFCLWKEIEIWEKLEICVDQWVRKLTILFSQKVDRPRKLKKNECAR